MNKKVALSLLSATVFASMAASAFAAPKAGVYMGGEVDRYYALTDLFKLNDQGLTKFQSDLTKAGFDNIVFVDTDKKGAFLKDFLTSNEDYEKIKRDLKQSDFEGAYTQANIDGTDGESYDPRKDITPDPDGELKVESVSAINGTQVFATTANQVLGFTINGKTEPADLAAVEAAGYTVGFAASKAVLADASGNPTTTNTTGKLLATLTTGTFDYQVVIKKDGNVVAESDFATVKIVNGASIKEITEVSTTATINGVSGVALSSNTISLASDTNILLDATKGITVDGKADQAVNGETFKSLNPSVALINANTGKITPVKAGTVTFEITAGEATKQVTYTIVNEARAVKTVTADVSEIKLTNNNAGKTVTLTAKDQFGDAAVVDLPQVASVKNASDQAITVAVDPAQTDKLGVTTILVKPVSGVQGSGTLQVKDANGTVLVSIPVTVGDGSVVASRKLETSATDNIIDPFNADDDEIVLTFNQYNADGLLIGPETSIDDEALDDVATPTYVVGSDKPSVATVAVDAQGEIKVKAVGQGQATIKVKEGALVRASYTVVVNDSTPTVAAVTFKSDAKVTEAGAYALSNVIDTVKTASGETLFLRKDGTINTEEDGSGVQVGSVKFVSGDWDSVKLDANGNIQYGVNDAEADPAAGDKGTIAINVLDKAGNVVDTYVLDVEVPADPQNLAKTLEKLNTLLADNSVSVILLGADITGNVTINRSVTIDGKGNKINGDVTINNADQNDVTLKDVTITGKTILN